MHSLILKVATRLLVGLILVFAVYLLFRGHNAPGGGFVAALVAGTGFALAAVSEGPAVVRRAIRIDPERIADTRDGVRGFREVAVFHGGNQPVSPACGKDQFGQVW